MPTAIVYVTLRFAVHALVDKTAVGRSYPCWVEDEDTAERVIDRLHLALDRAGEPECGRESTAFRQLLDPGVAQSASF